MSSEFTREVVTTFLFYQLSFLEFDVNVFKAILSIQRFFNLTEYREVIVKKIHCSVGKNADVNLILVAAMTNGFVHGIWGGGGVKMTWLDCNFHCLTI